MVGDPDRGFDKHQPGAWDYNVLPFIEQQTLHNLGTGMTGAAQAAANTQRIMTPLSVMNCPTRRNPLLFTVYPENYCGGSNQLYLCNPVTVVARGDYAACAGDSDLSQTWIMWVPYAQESTYPWPSQAAFTGIAFQRSEIKMCNVTDGTSNYMAGEKYIDSDCYFTGMDPSDDQNLYCGWNNDDHRTTNGGYPPMQDQPGTVSQGSFGTPTPSASKWPSATARADDELRH